MWRPPGIEKGPMLVSQNWDLRAACFGSRAVIGSTSETRKMQTGVCPVGSWEDTVSSRGLQQELWLLEGAGGQGVSTGKFTQTTGRRALASVFLFTRGGTFPEWSHLPALLPTHPFPGRRCDLPDWVEKLDRCSPAPSSFWESAVCRKHRFGSAFPGSHFMETAQTRRRALGFHCHLDSSG
jgi:hypothetical protein